MYIYIALQQKQHTHKRSLRKLQMKLKTREICHCSILSYSFMILHKLNQFGDVCTPNSDWKINSLSAKWISNSVFDALKLFLKYYCVPVNGKSPYCYSLNIQTMAVKFIRVFLAAVVLITLVANVLFILENWKLNVAVKPMESSTGETRKKRPVLLSEASSINQHVPDGEYKQLNHGHVRINSFKIRFQLQERLRLNLTKIKRFVCHCRNLALLVSSKIVKNRNFFTEQRV